MIIKEIMRQQAGQHIGYMPTSISITLFDPGEIGTKPLKKIPSKITAYFHRNLIKDAYRCSLSKDTREDYYILKATDGTLFHVDY